MMTMEELKGVLPKDFRGGVNEELLNEINGLTGTPESIEVIRDNFIGYVQVLREGKYRLQDYLNAVKYVSFRLMGFNNKESYQRAFPDRYNALVLKGTSDKDIAAYVAAYNRNQLVNKILAQTMVPPAVMFQDVFHKAVRVQAELMVSANSEKVRQDAANSLLTHLKPPEVKKMELDLGIKENSGISDLKEALRELAQQQIKTIEGGSSAKVIGRIPLTISDAEYTEVSDGKE